MSWLVTRKVWISIGSCILFAAIALKSSYIILFKDLTQKRAPDLFRFPIYDTNKKLLAFSEKVKSIYMNPQIIPDCMKEYIQREFKLNAIPKSSFLWLKRDAQEGLIEKFRALNIPGIYIKNDWKRVYPFKDVLSNLIGFCDKNLDGKYGVEYALNKKLFKENISLTIDLTIQKILAEILSKAIEQFEVEGASGLVVDAQSGEILAMVSLPCPEKATDFLEYRFRNRNIDPVEVGSILKLHNVAMALETGLFNLDSMIDGRGPLRISKFEINDFFGINDYMTLRESIWRSSNIASARVALQVGADEQKRFFKKFGLLDSIEWLNGCFAQPNIPRAWRKTTTATLAYGYGIGLSSLHVARSILRILHGYDIELKLYKDSSEKQLSRVISEKTSFLMRGVLEDVIRFSKSKKLKNTGYELGGKTGTANICIRGKYLEGRNFVTMVCVFPAKLPKILLLMQMKDPKKSKLSTSRFTTAGNVLSDYMARGVKRIGAARLIRV